MVYSYAPRAAYDNNINSNTTNSDCACFNRSYRPGINDMGAVKNVVIQITKILICIEEKDFFF